MAATECDHTNCGGELFSKCDGCGRDLCLECGTPGGDEAYDHCSFGYGCTPCEYYMPVLKNRRCIGCNQIHDCDQKN